MVIEELMIDYFENDNPTFTQESISLGFLNIRSGSGLIKAQTLHQDETYLVPKAFAVDSIALRGFYYYCT